MTNKPDTAKRKQLTLSVVLFSLFVFGVSLGIMRFFMTAENRFVISRGITTATLAGGLFGLGASVGMPIGYFFGGRRGCTRAALVGGLVGIIVGMGIVFRH